MEYITKEYKGNGYIGRVHIPILSEEENAKRIEECKKALVEFAKEVFIRKEL